MYKAWLRVILLTLAMLSLDLTTSINGIKSIAYADDGTAGLMPGGGRASHEDCRTVVGFELVMAAVSAGFTIIFIALPMLASSEPVSVVTAISLLAGVITTLGALVAANVRFFACTHGYVLHPVLRWEATGKYKKCKQPEPLYPGDPSSPYVCKSKEYTDESSYRWPENKAPYSDYIEVCYRYPLMPFLMFQVDKLEKREYEFGLKGDFTQKEIQENKKDDIVKMKEWFGMPGTPPCATLRRGESATIHTVTFRASETGGRLCANAVGSAGITWVTPVEIGCHARSPAPPGPMCAQSVPVEYDDKGRPSKYDHTKCFSCYISSACYSNVSLAARASFPITSVLVQCIKESLNNLVTGKCNAMVVGPVGATQTSFLGLIQQRLKSTVLAVLVLSVALFGIKMMLGHAIQGPAEYFMLLIKFALVIYFALGNGVQVYYDQLIRLSVGLSDIVLSAGGNNQVCNYETADYIKTLGGVKRDYTYLAPWDRLDCRISFYLGNGFAVGAGAASAAAIVAAATVPVFGVLLLIIPAIFAGQILIAICVAYFIFMLLLVIIWVVHLFILSLIALTIVMIFAPVFVPMVLFQATKGFFDGWLKELMAFSIYPIILFAFLSLVFSVFDKLYFQDLRFTSHIESKDVGDGKMRLIESFIPDYEKCKTHPTILACVVANMKFTEGTLILGIKVTKTGDLGDTRAIWQGFGMMGLMAFLFYHFLGVVGSMAAELSGSFRADLSQHVSSPKQSAAKIEAGASKIAGGVGAGLGKIARAAGGKGGGKDGDEGGKERVSGADSGDKGGGDKGGDSGSRGDGGGDGGSKSS